MNPTLLPPAPNAQRIPLPTGPGRASTAPRPPSSPTPSAAKPKAFGFAKIADATAQRIGIYGSGGLGKTSLACAAPGPVAIFDFDNSLPILKPTLIGLDIKPVIGVETFQDMRDALHDTAMWSGIKTIVIDSATKAEQLAVAYTLETVKNERGETVKSVEGYGFGKGYRHVAESWQLLLQDLDAHVRAGRNVVLIMHDCVQATPNPDGLDYIRWEPRLQEQKNGNIRASTKEWLDHLLCLRFDVSVSKDGKASGGGSRTIYPTESAVHVAKSRSLRDPIVYLEGSKELWNQLFGAQ